MAHHIVAIDLDDTLSATTKGVVAYASKLLATPMKLGDITSSAYWQSYGVDDQRAIDIVHGYNLGGFPGLRPLVGAPAIVQQLAKKYELHVVTSRDPVSRDVTVRWLDQYFPGAFREVIFAGNQFVSTTVQTKANLCADLGADLLVDDSLPHLIGCLDQGMTAVLFGDYPWTPLETPSGIVRAKTWQSILEYLDA